MYVWRAGWPVQFPKLLYANISALPPEAELQVAREGGLGEAVEESIGKEGGFFLEQNNNTRQIRPEDSNICNGGRAGKRNPNMSRGVGGG